MTAMTEEDFKRQLQIAGAKHLATEMREKLGQLIMLYPELKKLVNKPIVANGTNGTNGHRPDVTVLWSDEPETGAPESKKVKAKPSKSTSNNSKPRRSHSDDFRTKVVKAVIGGMKIAEAARQFDISRTLVDRWMALERTNKAKKKSPKGTKAKTTRSAKTAKGKGTLLAFFQAEDRPLTIEEIAAHYRIKNTAANQRALVLYKKKLVSRIKRGVYELTKKGDAVETPTA